MNEDNKSRLAILGLSLVKSLRIFRNNTGMGWIGKVVNRTPSTVTLETPRPLHAGLCTGSSDYIGWNITTITPEMIGNKIAVFVAIEFKADSGRASKEQLNFIEQIRKSGGIAGIAKSDKDILSLIDFYGAGRKQD